MGTFVECTLGHHQDFENDGDFTLQIIQVGERINIFFMHRPLLESTLAVVYHLKQINQPLTSLHYGDHPNFRLQKIDGTSRDRSDS